MRIIRNMKFVTIFSPQFIVPKYYQTRNQKQKEAQYDWQDKHVIVFADKKVRKSNSNFEAFFTVWISMFETIIFLLLVSKTFVGFRNEDKFSVCFRIIGIFVRMIFDSQFSISFSNLFVSSVGLDF
jgi:hypothetical protein